MPNFRMTLSYDGKRYNGWQRQGNTCLLCTSPSPRD